MRGGMLKKKERMTACGQKNTFPYSQKHISESEGTFTLYRQEK